MKGQGRVYRPKVNGRESQVWWLDYGVRGSRHRESSATTSKREAMALLRERIGKRTDGTLSGRPEKVTLADLKAELPRAYEREGRASWGRAEQAFAHIEEHFGADARAVDVTRARGTDYQDARRAEGAAAATIRYETAILSAAFNAAVRQERLVAAPKFGRIEVDNARQGFFEGPDFATVLAGLPEDIGAVAQFARLTGWRKAEVMGLTWSQVDWDDPDCPGINEDPIPGPGACVRIGSRETKGKDSRQFPFAGWKELRDVLLARWQARDGLSVFHRGGRPIKDFRATWEKACRAAGCPGRLFHDLRRTAARDFRRAGADQASIMKLAGWKTDSMFRRYNIIDDADLLRAVAQRSNGKGTANKAMELEAVE